MLFYLEMDFDAPMIVEYNSK